MTTADNLKITRDGRFIVDQWVRSRGHADLTAYCAATGTPWIEAYIEIIREITARWPLAQSAAVRILAEPPR